MHTTAHICMNSIQKSNTHSRAKAKVLMRYVCSYTHEVKIFF